MLGWLSDDDEDPDQLLCDLIEWKLEGPQEHGRASLPSTQDDVEPEPDEILLWTTSYY